jgi:hypothetical protein
VFAAAVAVVPPLLGADWGTWGDGVVGRRLGNPDLQRAIGVDAAGVDRVADLLGLDRFSAVYTPIAFVFAAAVAVVPPLLGADWGTWTSTRCRMRATVLSAAVLVTRTCSAPSALTLPA